MIGRAWGRGGVRNGGGAAGPLVDDRALVEVRPEVVPDLLPAGDVATLGLRDLLVLADEVLVAAIGVEALLVEPGLDRRRRLVAGCVDLVCGAGDALHHWGKAFWRVHVYVCVCVCWHLSKRSLGVQFGYSLGTSRSSGAEFVFTWVLSRGEGGGVAPPPRWITLSGKRPVPRVPPVRSSIRSFSSSKVALLTRFRAARGKWPKGRSQGGPCTRSPRGPGHRSRP